MDLMPFLTTKKFWISLSENSEPFLYLQLLSNLLVALQDHRRKKLSVENFVGESVIQGYGSTLPTCLFVCLTLERK